MVLTDRGPRPVRIPLRYGEWVEHIDGYPGTSRFSLSVRHNWFDDAMPSEVLTSEDWARWAHDVSLTKWGLFSSTGRGGVAVLWLNPEDQIHATYDESHRPAVSTFRLYRYRCGGASRVLYSGSKVLITVPEIDVPILVAGPSRLLVIVQRGFTWPSAHPDNSHPATGHWGALDTRTGLLTPTRAAWSSSGAWTYVLPPPTRVRPREDRAADCHGFASPSR